MLEILLKLKALVAGIFASTLIFFGASTPPAATPTIIITAENTASSTPAITASSSTPTTSRSTTTKGTSTPPRKIAVPAKKSAHVVVPKATTTATSTLTVQIKPVVPPQLLNLTTQNEEVRKATVNIICTTKGGGSFSPISGSGVIIDPRGIILTNAHIGQYYLFDTYPEEGFVDCTIRTGSPAEPTYKAELMYLSESWVRNNATHITETNALGTGQYDFALLRIITSVTTTKTLPTSFPFVAPDIDYTLIPSNSEVLIASYPAELVGSIATQRDLRLVSTVAVIERALYFTDPNTIDLFSVGGTIVAQAGSSGGAVVSRETGKLLGVLVTTTEGKTTDEKDLHAVTLPHVSSTLKSESGIGLQEFLNFDAEARARSWRQLRFNGLKQELERALEG